MTAKIQIFDAGEYLTIATCPDTEEEIAKALRRCRKTHPKRELWIDRDSDSIRRCADLRIGPYHCRPYEKRAFS